VLNNTVTIGRNPIKIYQLKAMVIPVLNQPSFLAMKVLVGFPHWSKLMIPELDLVQIRSTTSLISNSLNWKACL
jgi:hypothetical protein